LCCCRRLNLEGRSLNCRSLDSRSRASNHHGSNRPGYPNGFFTVANFQLGDAGFFHQLYEFLDFS
jgi:hypothetical protein